MNNSKLNLISRDELRFEIGDRGITQLIELGYWLALGENEISNWQRDFGRAPLRKKLSLGNLFTMPPRLAPSLVCKGEVELFGRSVPRFAIRLPLDGDSGFVNIRRLGTLAGQLHVDPLVPIDVIRLVLDAPCVADAFLHPPGRASNQWHMLTAPLAKACCELEHGCPDEELTPYVRHMKPGGGMCAQAACFMGSALHRKIDAPVHGMPEITYIATESQTVPQDRITFDGLFTHEIAAYFNNPGNKALRASWEGSKIQFGSIQPDVLFRADTSLVQDFGRALRGYVLSDVPVIVPVDVGRMQGACSLGKIKYIQRTMAGATQESEVDDPLLIQDRKYSIFKRNGLMQSNLETPAKNLAHVVLIVGCKKPDTFNNPFAPATHRPPWRGIDTLFSFNDPAHFPFMCATAHELLLASSYADKDPMDTLLLGWFLPITPFGVRMPLLDETVGNLAGIKGISEMLKQITFEFSGIPVKQRLTLAGPESEFRIFRAQRSEIVRHLKDLFGEDSNIEDQYSDILKVFPDTPSNQWCWLEIDGPNLLIWDAQQEVLKRTVFDLDELEAKAERGEFAVENVRKAASKLAEHILIAVSIVQQGSRINSCKAVFSAPVPSRRAVTRPCGLLEPSLLTSFEVIRNWPTVSCEREPLEFYMFMQSTADKLFLNLRSAIRRKLGSLQNRLSARAQADYKTVPIDRPSALELMATVCDDEKVIKKVAKKLLRGRARTIGVATYLPSLCSGEKGADFANLTPNPALLALKFVLRVIKEMKMHDPSRSPHIIEVVGGSRMLARIDCTGGKHFIRCIEENIAIQNIIACVRELLPDIVAAEAKLAFEYEPSRLTALGSLDTVTLFCKELATKAQEDEKWNRVGLNLDIAHFAFIGGYLPESLPEEVIKRVFHAHISMHTRGHLADGILEDNESELRKNMCMEWLVLLEKLKKTGIFSGFVSLELECAKTREQVNTSVENLKAWLKGNSEPLT